MRTSLKVFVALLTLCFGASLALAQDNTAPPPPRDTDGGPEISAAAGTAEMDPGPPEGLGEFGVSTGGWMQGGGMGMDRIRMRVMRMHGGMEGRRLFMLERLLNDPDLRQKVGITDEQAAKIRQETTSFRIAEIRNHASLQVQRLELENLMAADKPDRAALDKKLEEISATQLAAAKAGVDFRLTMRNALTPEQREKLKQLAAENRRFGERHVIRMRTRGMGDQQWQRHQGPPPASQAPANPGANPNPDNQD